MGRVCVILIIYPKLGLENECVFLIYYVKIKNVHTFEIN